MLTSIIAMLSVLVWLLVETDYLHAGSGDDSIRLNTPINTLE